MTYFDRNLLTDEQILFRTRKHLIIFLYPVLWTLLCIGCMPYMYSNPMLVKVIWGPWVAALALWGNVWLDYITSEYAVTNKRVMMREGFFTRHANELRLSAVAQVNIDQNLLGQLLDYGVISLNAFGAFDRYPMVAHPAEFQKTLNEQLEQVIRAS